MGHATDLVYDLLRDKGARLTLQPRGWHHDYPSAKLLLLAGIALFYTLVVFNNLTDFDSNYQFVRHVLSMDTTFPGNHGMWRALPSPAIHLAFYLSIIAWEFVTMLLLWGAVACCVRYAVRPWLSTPPSAWR